MRRFSAGSDGGPPDSSSSSRALSFFACNCWRFLSLLCLCFRRSIPSPWRQMNHINHLRLRRHPNPRRILLRGGRREPGLRQGVRARAEIVSCERYETNILGNETLGAVSVDVLETIQFSLYVLPTLHGAIIQLTSSLLFVDWSQWRIRYIWTYFGESTSTLRPFLCRTDDTHHFR